MPRTSSVHAVTTIGNGYGQEHTSHDWPRFAGRHRVAREGSVAALGDAPEDGSVSGRHLLGDEPDPCRKISSAPTFSHHAWYASSLILPVTGGSSMSELNVGSLKSPPRRGPISRAGGARPAQRPPTGLPARPVRHIAAHVAAPTPVAVHLTVSYPRVAVSGHSGPCCRRADVPCLKDRTGIKREPGFTVSF
jgi:hypothetical protein